MFVDFKKYFQEYRTGPLWFRVSQMIEKLIADNQLKHGDILPAERQLAEILCISRVSIRRAIIDLSAKGLVYRRQGSGTYVRSSQFSAQKHLTKLEGFTEDLLSRSLQPKTIILKNKVQQANKEQQQQLALKATDEVLLLNRLRFSDEQPTAIEEAVVPLKFLTNAYFEGPSLYKEFEKKGIKLVRAIQQLKATLFDDEKAKLLNVEAGSPALLILRQSFSEKGEMVEYTQSWFRADMHDYIVTIHMDSQNED